MSLNLMIMHCWRLFYYLDIDLCRHIDLYFIWFFSLPSSDFLRRAPCECVIHVWDGLCYQSLV
jgi:hypothetical protein